MNESLNTTKLAFTVSEAASMISLSRSTVYELIHAGKIKTIKVGRARRITAEQLKSFITKEEYQA